MLELDLERCPTCGGELKIIAAILEQPVIEKILTHATCRPLHRRVHQHAGRRCKRRVRSHAPPFERPVALGYANTPRARLSETHRSNWSSA